MKLLTAVLVLSTALSAFGQDQSTYSVKKGKLHSKGKILVTVLPEPQKFKVQMDYEVKKKPMVPVPDKLLRGKTVMEFPEKFKTEEGYKELERDKIMDIPKAVLKFVKKADYGTFKNAYFLDVFPKNKKTKINIIYHPSVPSAGWIDVKLEFISEIPVLDGYRIEATLKR